MDSRLYIALLVCLCTAVCAEEVITNNRNEKLISVFQVVKFTNTHCSGKTYNGTCYTSAECSNLGGTTDGTCADGFGVCCIVRIAIGKSTSQNNSYLYIASTIADGAHTFEVCPCSDDICRIKFDFTTFQLAGPNSGYGFKTLTGTAANAINVGRCLDDTFSISSPSGRSSPQICGNNANQHMILDASGMNCMSVNLGIGGTVTVTRAMDIKVTQYKCGDENGGPTGCLQYYPNTAGKIRSFNFPDAAVGATLAGGYTYHLTDQDYKICIRKGAGNEIICWQPCTNIVGATINTAGSTPTAQPSFGLSATAEENIAESNVDSHCSTDYIWIRPGNDVSTNFVAAIDLQNHPITIARPTRFCGRYFGTTAAGTVFISHTICSYSLPFEVGVKFDEQDICTAVTGMDNCESLTETTEANKPGGSGNLGFSMCYTQHINT